MMTCEKCGCETFIIYITRNHRKICDRCRDRNRIFKRLRKRIHIESGIVAAGIVADAPIGNDLIPNLSNYSF